MQAGIRHTGLSRLGATRTKTRLERLAHGGQVPDQRLRIVPCCADVAGGVRGPGQCVHRCLVPLQLCHWQRGEPDIQHHHLCMRPPRQHPPRHHWAAVQACTHAPMLIPPSYGCISGTATSRHDFSQGTATHSFGGLECISTGATAAAGMEAVMKDRLRHKTEGELQRAD